MGEREWRESLEMYDRVVLLDGRGGRRDTYVVNVTPTAVEPWIGGMYSKETGAGAEGRIEETSTEWQESLVVGDTVAEHFRSGSDVIATVSAVSDDFVHTDTRRVYHTRTCREIDGGPWDCIGPVKEVLDGSEES